MESLHSPIQSLSIDSVGATIQVRVARMWDSINLKSNDVFAFNMQLLDNKGEEIHAFVGPRFMPLFLGKLKEGLIYDIGDFTVTPAGDTYLPVHRPIKIDFTALTTVTEVENDDNTIPSHKFSFADYQSIVNRTNTVKYLIDVIGVLHHVGDAVNQPTGNGSVAAKRELILYLHCGNRITATLWGNKASLIDDSAVHDTSKTIILTSMTVKNYRGKPSLSSTTATFVYTDFDIAEGSDLLKSFRKRKLPAFSAEDIVYNKPADLITDRCISEIISSGHPSGYEGKIFSFEAKITGLSLDNGWEYLSCNVCKTRITTSGPKNYCNKCARDIEFPLHRFRLEVIADDGTASIPIVLFDKVAEFVLRQKADSLYQIQKNEVGGEKKVTTILEQLIGRTENFQAKLDTYVNSIGRKKLTATRICPPTTDNINALPQRTNTKVPSSSDNKVTNLKGNPRKKNRNTYVVHTRDWGYELYVTNTLLTQRTVPNQDNEDNKSSLPILKVDIHGQVDEHITLLQSILPSRGIQVNISPLMAPQELASTLERSRIEKRRLQHLKEKICSKKVHKYMCSVQELEIKINNLENCIPLHTTPSGNSANKVTVRLNNSISGVYITSSDLLTVLSTRILNTELSSFSKSTYAPGLKHRCA